MEAEGDKIAADASLFDVSGRKASVTGRRKDSDVYLATGSLATDLGSSPWASSWISQRRQ